MYCLVRKIIPALPRSRIHQPGVALAQSVATIAEFDFSGWGLPQTTGIPAENCDYRGQKSYACFRPGGDFLRFFHFSEKSAT